MVSIKTQKIISYIPLFNATVLFIWLYNYRTTIKKPEVFAKSLLVIFLSTIPLACLYRFMLSAFATSSIAFSLEYILGLYFIPFIMARCLIRFQVNILNK